MNNDDDKPIWVIDAETDPFEYDHIPEPFIWGVYCGYAESGFYREFTGSGPAHICLPDDIDCIVDFLAGNDVIVYAHNGGKFDYHFLSRRFESDSDILIIHGRIARFKIGKCEFRDSYNLMSIPLEQYQKTKFDYSKMRREHRMAHMPEIREYLKSDCVNLWNMVSGFNKEYGTHITQATAAMHFWQKRMKNKVPRSGASFYDKFKPYYYGGRVQCFAKGDLQQVVAKSADINSAYSFGMLSKHPYGLDFSCFDGWPKEPVSEWGPMLFTVECKSKGAFPYRSTDRDLYYPGDDDLRIYTVTGWELIAAIETKTVENLSINEYYKFDDCRDFSEYVNFFWNRREDFRQKGDEGARYYCKIFLNALYGKFATDPRKYRNYTLRPQSALMDVLQKLGEMDSFHHFREWLIVSENKNNPGKGRFYNLATAASITGYVRAMLWRAICEAKEPLYCDTDCILALGFGADMRLSAELGDWSIEHEYDRVIIAGKKLYAMRKTGKLKKDEARWKVASKGARLTANEMIRVAHGELVTFKNDAPTFSAAKAKPVFISRNIIMTGTDVSRIPKHIDPKYVKLSTL